MKSLVFKNKILPVLVVVLGGLLSIVLVYATYFAIYMLIEKVFYPNPMLTPTGLIRTATSMGLCLIWVLLYRLRIPDMIKAAMGVGPLTMLMVVFFFTLYETPVWAILTTAGMGLITALMVFIYKKQWFYYLVPAIAFIVSTWYAWPQP